MISFIKKLKLDDGSWWKTPVILLVNFFALMFALLPFMSTLCLTGIVFVDYLINTSVVFIVAYLANALCLSTLNVELENMIMIKHYFSVKYLILTPFLVAFGIVGLLTYFNTILFLVFGVISFVLAVMFAQFVTIRYFESVYPEEGNKFKKIMTIYSIVYLSILFIVYAII